MYLAHENAHDKNMLKREMASTTRKAVTQYTEHHDSKTAGGKQKGRSEKHNESSNNKQQNEPEIIKNE